MQNITWPVLDLPKDRPYPAVPTYQGAVEPLVLSAQLTHQLQVLSQHEEAALVMLLLAAWKMLLVRICQQEDIVVGYPIAERTHSELEAPAGFFVKMLVLRTDLSGTPTFRQALACVRATTLAAYAHQDLPLAQRVDTLHPQRSEEGHPLIQVVFGLQSVPAAQSSLPGLTLQPGEPDHDTTSFDLTVLLQEQAGQLIGSCEYRRELFDPPTIRRLLTHWQALLEQIVRDPDLPLSQLELLTPWERQQLLVDWNATSQPYPPASNLHQLLEDQLQHTPHALAVVCGEQQFTYHELNQRANQLAHYLQQRGIGPERCVGLFLERSADFIIGLLAILKAGGAYVPLDPAHPRERLTFILQDARIALVLTHQALLSRLPADQAPSFCLDTDWPGLVWQPDHPLCQARPENLVSIIYTSGSTGRPKGVALEHRQLLNYTRSAIERFGFTPGRSFALLQSLIADFGNTLVFSALCTGGTLHILSLEQSTDPSLLHTYFSRYQIDCLKITSSHLATLLAATPDDTKDFLPGRWLIQGGEVFHWDTIRAIQARKPSCRIFNHYGPTEATVGVLTYQVPQDYTDHTAATVPIGRPLANTCVYLLDAFRQPVPIGVPGELYIGGAGVARGYLNQAALTAEVFIHNPFSTDPQARLYKTGDLARYLPDGNIEFLGRIDHQIKIRGYRIEPGEIEAVLQEHPALQAGIVAGRPDTSGQMRLLAYVIPRSGSNDLTGHQLREYLHERLPEYMLPSAFLLLASFPLLPNGKVNRQRLFEMTPQAERSTEKQVMPRSQLEKHIAMIWEQLLDRTSIGSHDNFFALGGHSLLATRVISRLRATLQIELPVRTLFEAPTVAALASRIQASDQQAYSVVVPPMQHLTQRKALPLSFAQQRLWFIDQLETQRSFYNEHIAVHLSGQLHPAALQQSLQMLLQRHEVLRTLFVEQEGEPLQIITEDQTICFSHTSLMEAPEGTRTTRALQMARLEIARPFDLANGPLLRARLFQIAAQKHLLILTIHHIICDGWSKAILWQELATLYQACLADLPSPLPDLPFQYADFAHWQRSWLQGEVLHSQLTYWTRQLGQELSTLRVPTDRPHPAAPTFQGAVEPLVLSTQLTHQLQTLSQHEGATLFMLLLTAWKMLLVRICQQEDIVVGSPIAGRTHIELEALIGFFVNMLVLRTDLSGAPTFRQALARVRETTLAAYAHQDLPFEQLVEALHPQRTDGRNPLVQVVFGLQSVPVAQPSLPGLTLQHCQLDNDTARFDLTLLLQEQAGQLIGTCEYRCELFDPPTIRRLLTHWQTLLEHIVRDPDLPLGELSMHADIIELDTEDLEILFAEER